MKMKMFIKRAAALLTAIALLLGLVFVPNSNETAEAAETTEAAPEAEKAEQ